MWRSFLAGTLMLALGATLAAQERRSRIDVEHYVITAEIDPDAQMLKAEVRVRFLPLDDSTSSLSFELNNALSVSSVTGESGQPLPAARLPQDEGIRVSFPEPLAKGKPSTLVFRYDGALTGSESSPIYGIKFAAIHKDFAFLLYPARWFPISGYTSDRYTYEAKITVPAGNRVIASGTEKSEPAAAGKVSLQLQHFETRVSRQHRRGARRSRARFLRGRTRHCVLPRAGSPHGQRLRRGVRQDPDLPHQRVRRCPRWRTSPSSKPRGTPRTATPAKGSCSCLPPPSASK